MSELERSDTGGAVAAAGGIISTAVKYTIVIAQLAWASIKLRGLSEQVRSTYRYIDGCSASVDRLAQQMAGMAVDRDTVVEHHQAAVIMRGVLAEADAMAVHIETLSTMFDQASAAHKADYGPVADTANNMPVPMADAEFYSNR